jgi:hypothetical protein
VPRIIEGDIEPQETRDSLQIRRGVACVSGFGRTV